MDERLTSFPNYSTRTDEIVQVSENKREKKPNLALLELSKIRRIEPIIKPHWFLSRQEIPEECWDLTNQVQLKENFSNLMIGYNDFIRHEFTKIMAIQSSIEMQINSLNASCTIIGKDN
jgi:hypothetical protein